jgi:hypothetical protein
MADRQMSQLPQIFITPRSMSKTFDNLRFRPSEGHSLMATILLHALITDNGIRSGPLWRFSKQWSHGLTSKLYHGNEMIRNVGE